MTIRQIGRAIIDGRPTVLLREDGRLFDLSFKRLPTSGAPCDVLRFALADDLRADNPLPADVINHELPLSAMLDLLSPLTCQSKLICIGTNYTDHMVEMGITETPRFPYAFLKPWTTIAVPGVVVRLPGQSKMVDWEAELGVVIGHKAKSVAASSALSYVAAYAPINDVSARDWLDDRPSVGVDWVMQKGFDGFTPLGPWLTLASSIPDPQELRIECHLNTKLVQRSSTANMVFSVAKIIEHLSAIMTLLPGDVIATGTPAGVGYAKSPRMFIRDNDIVSVTVGSLGELRTRFVAENGTK